MCQRIPPNCRGFGVSKETLAGSCGIWLSAVPAVGPFNQRSLGKNGFFHRAK